MIEAQSEADDEDDYDEFDSEYEVEDVRAIFPLLCEKLQKKDDFPAWQTVYSDFLLISLKSS